MQVANEETESEKWGTGIARYKYWPGLGINIKKTKTLNERNDIDEKIFNNEKWLSGRVRELEDVCGG